MAFLRFLTFLAIAAVSGCVAFAIVSPPDNASHSSRLFQLRDSAERHIRASLRDPDSLVFRVKHSSIDPVPVVCGEYNAKNGFGGMVGFQPFVFYGNSRSILTPTGTARQRADFMAAWIESCAPSTRAP